MKLYQNSINSSQDIQNSYLHSKQQFADQLPIYNTMKFNEVLICR